MPPREDRQPRREGVREAAQQREHANRTWRYSASVGTEMGDGISMMHTLCLGWKTADRFLEYAGSTITTTSSHCPLFPVPTLLGVPNTRPHSTAIVRARVASPY